MKCNVCPRHCNAERTEHEGKGFCHMGTLPVVSRAAAHYWEEPCLSGTRGSGTVFFSGCSLGCVFCQNEPISHHELGRAMTPRQLAELFRRLEETGVHNLNLVTPSHFAPAIFEALSIRKPGVPVVWNSSGYEALETVEQALPARSKVLFRKKRRRAGCRTGLFRGGDGGGEGHVRTDGSPPI